MDTFTKYTPDPSLFPYPRKEDITREAKSALVQTIDAGEKIYDTQKWITDYVNTTQASLRKAYNEENSRLQELFWYDAFQELGISAYSEHQLNVLRELAWDRGHSNGYSNVYSELEDICDFLQRFGYSHLSETAKAQENKMLANLLVYAMRYSLNRFTGAFWEVANAIKYFWSRLDSVTQAQILKEVKEAPMDLPDDRVAEHHDLVTWIKTSTPKKASKSPVEKR